MAVIITGKGGASDVVGCTVQCQSTESVEWVTVPSGADSIQAIENHARRCPNCGSISAEVMRKSYIHPPYVLINDIGREFLELLGILDESEFTEDPEVFRSRIEKSRAEIYLLAERSSRTESLYIQTRLNLLERLISWCIQNRSMIRLKHGVG